MSKHRRIQNTNLFDCKNFSEGVPFMQFSISPRVSPKSLRHRSWPISRENTRIWRPYMLPNLDPMHTPTICPGEATASPWVDKHFRCLKRSDLKFAQQILTEIRYFNGSHPLGKLTTCPPVHCSWKLWESSRVSLTIIDTYRAPLTMAA